MSCPICARDTDAKFRPFCSKRCADVDLARWVNGSYAVPSEREGEIDVDLDQEVARDLPH
ncbi:MAG: DNA gyrase inhibitor YacG [Ascidiaceihabitans sp.]|nr:DNA gyrase inhibitor YacG [Ascidiaceihabitans sp.]